MSNLEGAKGGSNRGEKSGEKCGSGVLSLVHDWGKLLSTLLEESMRVCSGVFPDPVSGCQCIESGVCQYINTLSFWPMRAQRLLQPPSLNFPVPVSSF